MLIITRKPGQRFMIGADIIVSIDRINGNQVRIGIEAPPNVKILREEVQDRDAPTMQSQERQG